MFAPVLRRRNWNYARSSQPVIRVVCSARGENPSGKRVLPHHLGDVKYQATVGQLASSLALVVNQLVSSVARHHAAGMPREKEERFRFLLNLHNLFRLRCRSTVIFVVWRLKQKGGRRLVKVQPKQSVKAANVRYKVPRLTPANGRRVTFRIASLSCGSFVPGELFVVVPRLRKSVRCWLNEDTQQIIVFQKTPTRSWRRSREWRGNTGFNIQCD